MRVPMGLAVVGGLCVCVTAGGQPPPKLPAKVTVARTEYQKAVDKARTAYEEAVKQAGDKYKRQLTAGVEEATKAGKLDAAVFMRDELKAIEAGAAADRKNAGRAELAKALANTVWNWGEAALVFQPDGVARQAAWEGRKLVTKWKAVDRRTVMLHIDEGRDVDLVAVLEFSEGLDEFVGVGFDGRSLEPRRRLPGGGK